MPSTSGDVHEAGAHPRADTQPSDAFRRWYWLLVPLLALVAYATVLRIGFLQDDFALISEAEQPGIRVQDLLPVGPSPMEQYRPVMWLLLWKLGWVLWGFNPLPYHVVGLLGHAAGALVLGLWLAEATSRRALGWLAGALFAVFPLHLDAVGWLGTQWDVWAMLFGSLSLWIFTIWWRRTHTLWLYSLSLACYVLGLFTKETMLAFLPMLAVSAWFVTPRFVGKTWRLLGLALLPFCLVLALNVGLRLRAWGKLGGYRSARTDYGAFFWDAWGDHVRLLLSPINPQVFGPVVPQVVGALVSLALLIGLIWYGHAQRRVLLMSASWLLVALAPVLNLPVGAQDLENSRALYMVAAGYCIGVGAILEAALLSAPRYRRLLAKSFLGLLLLASTAVCWLQLRPWHTASVQVAAIEDQLRSLIPPQPPPNNQMWYVENLPSNYRGIYMLQIGLEGARHFTTGETPPSLQEVPNVTKVYLTDDTSSDAFAFRFHYFEDLNRFYIDYIAGITGYRLPPTGAGIGKNALVWDFTSCAPGMIGSWQVIQAKSSCQQGKGLVLDPSSSDPQMVGPPLSVKPEAAETHFVRLRVSVCYPSGIPPDKYVNEWFWKGPGNDWGGERLRSTLVKADGESHVYWTFLPVNEVGQVLTGLRFDPINAKIAAEIQWIAVDLVW